MTAMLTLYLGWLATGVFVGSYFFTRPAALRAAQMGGASLWIVYGVLIHAAPVVAANALVLAAAAWTTFSPARTAGKSVQCGTRRG
jgi:hypothetical protein